MAAPAAAEAAVVVCAVPLRAEYPRAVAAARRLRKHIRRQTDSTTRNRMVPAIDHVPAPAAPQPSSSLDEPLPLPDGQTPLHADAIEQ